MRLANNYDRISSSGAELVAMSVDDEVRQAGMAQRWGFDQTQFVADPDGQTYLRRLDLFDPEERGGIALPAMLLIGPDGTEVYRYKGRDFADRTTDDDLWAALDALDLPAVAPATWSPDVAVPDDLDRYFRPADFAPYFRGNFYAALAIRLRLGDAVDAAIAEEHRAMAEATLEAHKAWRSHIP